jgi:hypothetical protein
VHRPPNDGLPLLCICTYQLHKWIRKNNQTNNYLFHLVIVIISGEANTSNVILALKYSIGWRLHFLLNVASVFNNISTSWVLRFQRC